MNPIRRVYQMSHAQRITLIFCALLVISMAAKNIAKPTMHSVYPTYADVGRVWWSDQHDCESESAAYVRKQYGPVFAQLMGPWCWLPDRVGGAAWSIFSLTILLTGFSRFLHRLVPEFDRRQRLAATLLMPWCGVTSIYNGQANVLIAGCALWAVALVRERRWRLAGLVLAIPVCIKVYPVAVALLLIVLYPRKLAAPFALAVAGLSLSPLLTHSADVVMSRYQGWLAFLVSGRYYATNFVVIDLRTFMARWLIDIAPGQYLAVQLLTALGVWACIWLRARAVCDQRATLVHALVLGSFWMVLFGPATEEATFLLIGPAAALILVSAARRSIAPIRQALLITAFVIAGPLQTSILGEPVRLWVLDWKLAPVAASLFFAYAVARSLHPIIESIPVPLRSPVTLPT